MNKQTSAERASRLDELSKTGSGTRMGQLLRRYWWPIAGLSEFDERPTRRVRLLGEDLVAFKDASGRFAILQQRCPHRGADLVDGVVEDCGIRCSYHGWLFSGAGECLEAPFEDSSGHHFYRRNVAVRAYPTETLGGLLWTYMGPLPTPLLPRFEFFDWANGFRQIVISSLPCNWFQCQENSMDPVHFEWRHTNWALRATGATNKYSPRHKALEFEEFDYGFRYRRLREGAPEDDPLWTIGRICLWPNGLYTGNHVEFRVPIDDLNTLSVAWHFSRVPKEREPYVQTIIPTWHGPTQTADGEWIVSHVTNQDFVAWVGQGRVVDRSKEHLASSDRGIVMMRNRFFRDLEAIERGEDPKAVIRDSLANVSIRLPAVERELMLQGASLAELLRDTKQRERLRGFIFQAGQPESVRRSFIEAMGLENVRLEADSGPVDFLAQ